MNKYNRILILSLCPIIAAIALGVFAFRLARQDEDYRRNEAGKLLDNQCNQTIRDCRSMLDQEISGVQQALRSARPQPQDLHKLEQTHPLIRSVFLMKRDGSMVYLSDPDSIKAHYRSLFLEKGSPSSVHQESTLPAQTDNASASPERMVSEFQRLIRYRNEGWISWYSQNQFLPIVWTEVVNHPDQIVGAQIETIALKSLLIPFFSLPGNSIFHLQLIDTNTGVICGSGFPFDANSALKPVFIGSVNTAILPGWQVQGFLNPTYLHRSSMALANSLLIASLLLIMAVAALVIFHLVRREIIVASQKTTFVANVSHELKTPLTSIRMYSELMLHGFNKLKEEKKQHYLKVIISESERLSRLITNVLDFSKLEAGEKKYNPQRFELGGLLSELEPGLKTLVDEYDMTLTVVLPQTELYTQIDRDSLIQVIQNLVTNGVKYASSGKELTIELVAPSDQQVLIHILDRGNGIPSDQRYKIFNKFYRVDDQLTSSTSGSGLGLTISRGLMRDQLADLVYTPRTDGGSQFTIVLPNKTREE